VYYRAGKHYMGLKEKCGDVVSRDEARKKFKERLKNDTEFREKTLRWTKNSVDKYLTDYDERGRVGGPNIHDSDTSMISSLYLLGDLVKKEGKTAIVTIRDGSKKEFQTCHVCPYDPSHDCETKDLGDDVCAIKGFGEASLLKIMRRRLVEKLSIYTYVGDIVLCLNPYMYLPAMVDVKEYPDHVQFKLGQNPHSYASAHFAYWGALKPELYPGQPERNQSCVVSGESGAGKTVACGFIMKYLKKLSDWRKIELKENESKESGSDITSLVAGVSPFLEAFGNAKTNMNGKF
jgi:myosin heavy subunit